MTYDKTEAARLVTQLRLPNPLSRASQDAIAEQLEAASMEIERLTNERDDAVASRSQAHAALSQQCSDLERAEDERDQLRAGLERTVSEVAKLTEERDAMRPVMDAVEALDALRDKEFTGAQLEGALDMLIDAYRAKEKP